MLIVIFFHSFWRKWRRQQQLPNR